MRPAALSVLQMQARAVQSLSRAAPDLFASAAFQLFPDKRFCILFGTEHALRIPFPAFLRIHEPDPQLFLNTVFCVLGITADDPTVLQHTDAAVIKGFASLFLLCFFSVRHHSFLLSVSLHIPYFPGRHLSCNDAFLLYCFLSALSTDAFPGVSDSAGQMISSASRMIFA